MLTFPSLIAGVKGITPLNLYRAKFFRGCGFSANLSFGIHYRPRSDEEYDSMWEMIKIRLSETNEYKYYDLAAAVLNQNGAALLARHMEFGKHRKRPLDSSSGSPSKRPRNSIIDCEPEDEIS